MLPGDAVKENRSWGLPDTWALGPMHKASYRVSWEKLTLELGELGCFLLGG